MVGAITYSTIQNLCWEIIEPVGIVAKGVPKLAGDGLPSRDEESLNRAQTAIMPTTNVRPDSDGELRTIADVLAKSRKVVVITGAGISTNCGIPVSFYISHNIG